MGKMKELTVWMENKPATLAGLGEALGKVKVNILAFMTDEAEGQSRPLLESTWPTSRERWRKLPANLEAQASTSTTGTRGLKKAPRNNWSSFP